MLVDRIAAVIGRERGSALDDKMRDVWKLWAEGRLTDGDAERLRELVEERRAALRQRSHARPEGGQRLLACCPPLPGFRKPPKSYAAEPVRAESWRKGREAGFWRALTARDADDLMKAARRYDDAKREKGKRIGPLGPVGLEVLRLMVNTARLHRGHVYPALTWIMDKLRRSKSAVVAALAALRAHGFLDWRRRYEPTANEGRGPQVRQISNAYRLIPETARKLLGMFVKPSPIPSDVEQRRQEREAESASYEKFERESAQRSETESDLYSYARKRADGLIDRQLFRPLAGLADGRRR